MTTATTLLNTIATELNTTDKNLCINVALVTLMKKGLSIDLAMDAILGEGAYMKLATKVYHQLRGEA